jgi:hypothetical protein
VLTLSGESIKTLIDRTVRRAFAEGLNDAGLDTPVLVSLWCAGFMEGARAPEGRSPDEANQAVAAELERLGVDGVVTCEFPSTIGTGNDVAAAGGLVTKLVAIGASGVPIVGFEIKRNTVAVRSKRPLTGEDHERIRVACGEYIVDVLGMQARGVDAERSKLIDFITRGTGMSVDDLRDATITLLRIVANAVSKLQAEVQP